MIFASETATRFKCYLNTSGRQNLRFLTLAAMIGAFIPLNAQEQAKSRADPPLILTGTITMPNVEGRIDQFAIDPGGRLFVCVVGNDTIEVLETLNDKRIHKFRGVNGSLRMWHPSDGVTRSLSIDRGDSLGLGRAHSWICREDRPRGA